MDVGCSNWLGFVFNFLFYWKSELQVFPRFTIISFGGIISLLPFYLFEEFYLFQTQFDQNFFLWVLFAAVSPGIIAFALYTLAQQKLGASVTGFTLYLFTVYGAFYGIFLFDEVLQIYHYVGTILVFFGIYLVKKNLNMKYKMLLGKILFYIFIIYVGVSTVVYFYQRKLLYHPGEITILMKVH